MSEPKSGVDEITIPASECFEKGKVAVIAIHGVGMHPAFKTAEIIADLIDKPFEKTGLQLPVSPLKIPNLPVLKTSSCFNVFNNRSPRLQQILSEKTKPDDRPALDLDLTRDQLARYTDEEVYETVRLSHRSNKSCLDVYEMWWSDIARARPGFVHMFAELYQILFQVVTLSNKTVDYARAQQPCSSAWWWSSESYAWASRFFRFPILIFNLFLLASALLIIPATLSDGARLVIAGCSTALAILTLSGLSLFEGRMKLAISLLILMVAIFVGASQVRPSAYVYGFFVTAEWALLELTAIFLMMIAYEKRQSGAIAFTIKTIIVFVTLFVVLAVKSQNDPATFNALMSRVSLGLVESFFNLLQLSWAVFVVLTVAGALFSMVASWSIGPAGSAERIDGFRTARTARLGFALSVSTFLLLTLGLYSGLYQVTVRFLPSMPVHLVKPDFKTIEHLRSARLSIEDLLSNDKETGWDIHTVDKSSDVVGLSEHSQQEISHRVKLTAVAQLLTVPYEPLGRCSWYDFGGTTQCDMNLNRLYAASPDECMTQRHPDNPKCLSDHFPITTGLFLAQLLALSAGRGFVYVIALLLLALLLSLVALIPSIITEVRQPGAKIDPGRLGQWLSQGYKLLGLASDIAFVAMFVVLPATSFYFFISPQSGRPDWSATYVILSGLGALIVASAAGLMGLRQRLDTVSAAMGPVIDVLCDVESYLRQRPLCRTPRARIYARYASLLRFLLSDSAPCRYEAIIIVAHSQGTVITADLLRLLHSQKGELLAANGLAKLATLPVHFLTFGSPLLQLYRHRFPYLYQWVRRSPEELMECHSLGVKTWVNGYRSGDYVGRALWLLEGEEYWRTTYRPAEGEYREFCVGVGAHTHYFDERNGPVALLLNNTIAGAMSRCDGTAM